jgi:hypothetical protein
MSHVFNTVASLIITVAWLVVRTYIPAKINQLEHKPVQPLQIAQEWLEALTI